MTSELINLVDEQYKRLSNQGRSPWIMWCISALSSTRQASDIVWWLSIEVDAVKEECEEKGLDARAYATLKATLDECMQRLNMRDYEWRKVM